jgi:hypothetical protein
MEPMKATGDEMRPFPAAGVMVGLAFVAPFWFGVTLLIRFLLG